jgi:integrase
MRPLLDDLDLVSAARGHVGRRDSLLWLPGGPFEEDDLRNWRRRWFGPAADAVGVEATPKTLRHSFASVCAAAGMLRVGAWLERHGTLLGLAADLRDELERDRHGFTDRPV